MNACYTLDARGRSVLSFPYVGGALPSRYFFVWLAGWLALKEKGARVCECARERERASGPPFFWAKCTHSSSTPFPFPPLHYNLSLPLSCLSFRGFRRRRRRAITTGGEGRSKENNPSKSGLSLYILYVQRTREGRFLFFSYVQTMVRHFWQKNISLRETSGYKQSRKDSRRRLDSSPFLPLIALSQNLPGGSRSQKKVQGKGGAIGLSARAAIH